MNAAAVRPAIRPAFWFALALDVAALAVLTRAVLQVAA